MAVYKVPQDVEAEDKLLGPFSFRQFVYLIIAGVGGIVAWLLWNLSPVMGVIPLPVIVFFVVLALPLRKDQPMEIYLIALVQFILKPKRRLWAPDGTMSMVQITAPKAVERHLTKGISENEAIDRLSYLAQIMDTRGWAARGVQDASVVNNSVSTDIALEAEKTEDVLDRSGKVGQSFDTLIEKKDADRRQEAIASMRKHAGEPTQNQPAQQVGGPAMPVIPNNPYSSFVNHPPTSQPATEPAIAHAAAGAPPSQIGSSDNQHVQYNPYPTAMHQQVIQPMGSSPQPNFSHVNPPIQPPTEPVNPVEKKPSVEQVSPDIINLANNTDLTISTIAHEARRIQEKQDNPTEVVIPLR